MKDVKEPMKAKKLSPLRHRLCLAAGAALLLTGAVSLMVPASASPPRLPAPTAGVLKMADAPNLRTTTTSTTTTTQPTQGNPGGIVSCPAGDPSYDTCADMPCTAGSYCGVIVAGPTTNLGPNQFVYLNLSAFAPGDNGISVYYCSDPGGAKTLGATAPVCGNQYPQGRQTLQTFPSNSSSTLPPGTTEASVEAAEVSSPSTALPAQQYFPTVPVPAGFYCDSTDPCSIVITDASINHLPASTSFNSVQIPLSFAPTTNGCPNAPVVSTESEFGIDVLIPELARLSCANDPSNAVIPFETATDGLQAVTDLASGQQQIAFTDDPESADQQAQLKSGSFALIPVALTANVVGFFSQLNVVNSGFFNQDQMNLTPTMAAGLLTTASNYNGATSTDNSVACSGPSAGTTGSCLPLQPCFGPGSTCSLYLQLNYINGFEPFTGALGYQRSDNSGATDQLFNWLCTAPVVPLDFGSQPTESMSGAQELELGLTPTNGPPVTSCPVNTDQVPPVGGAPHFTEVNDPNQQALKAYNSVVGSGSSNPLAAFADLNWAEASYFGMNVAGLQNAAGNFVQPTPASLDAALADAKTNPDGTLTPQNLASDPAAYPMPTVIYAAVSTAAMPQNQATAISQLLTQMLQVTSGTEGTQDPSAQLPLGFVPLPANLVTAAQNDVQNDIHVLAVTATPPPSSTSNTGNTGNTGNTSNTGNTGNTGQGASGDLTSIGGDIIGAAGILSPFVQALLGGVTAGATAGAAAHHSDLPLLGPALPAFALVAGHGKAILQVATILGLSALALGVLLMAGGFVSRRRLLRVAPVAVDDAVPDGPSP